MSDRTDLERAVTFTGYNQQAFRDNSPYSTKSTTITRITDNNTTSVITPTNAFSGDPTQYNRMDDDGGILDEEHWNWPVLLARILCFFLLFLIILCVGLEALTQKFLILAAIICGALVFVIVGTYVDPRKWLGILCRCQRSTDPTPARTFTSDRNSTISASVVSSSSVENPIQLTNTRR